MTGGVLVAGVGNLFLGDDGFGPEVARRLAAAPVPGTRVVDYGIRGMHLAYDLLEGYDALVLVDAVPFADGCPGEVRILEITANDLGEGRLDAHGMDPASVLANLEALGGHLPRTFLVGCQPADLEEGIGLSPRVREAVDPAVARVQQLVAGLRARPAAGSIQTGGG